MIAQADVVTRLLQCDVLRPPENVKRADRRSRVLRSKDESAYRSQDAVDIERLIKPPPPVEEREDGVGAITDDHKVERITGPITVLVRRTTRQRLQSRAE